MVGSRRAAAFRRPSAWQGRARLGRRHPRRRSPRLLPQLHAWGVDLGPVEELFGDPHNPRSLLPERGRRPLPARIVLRPRRPRELARCRPARHRRAPEPRVLREVSRLVSQSARSGFLCQRFSISASLSALGDRTLAGRLLAGPKGDFGAFEGAVAGAFGSDSQGPFSRERRQIQGGFEVSSGMVSVVAQDGPTHQDSSVRIDQGNSVRGFGVAGVAVYREGIGDAGVRAWLDEDRVAALRGERRLQVSLWLEVDDEACGIPQLDHPVEERLARKDVHEHASLGGAHDVKTLEQPIAEFAIRYARRAGRRQGYAQKAVALLAHEAPLRYGTGGLQAGPEGDYHPLVVLVNLVAHREHGVRIVAGTTARLRLRYERDPGGGVSSPGEIALDLRSPDGSGLGHVSRTRHVFFRGLRGTARRGPDR